MKEAGQKSDVDRRELSERDEKIEELELRVQLLADGLENVTRIQSKVTSKDVKVTATPVALLPSSKALDVMTQAHASLQSGLDALHAAGERYH